MELDSSVPARTAGRRLDIGREAIGAPAPTTARRTFAQRYRLIRARWNEEWWSIMLGGPLGNLINARLADVAWVTPNRITWVGFLLKLVGGPLLLLRTPSADVLAVVLLQLNVVCDCMDGSLARYRKAASVLGSFLDKITDVLGLLTVMAAVGWRVYLDTGDAGALLVAVLAGTSIVVRGYVYWVVAHLERERQVEAPSVGVDARLDCSSLTLGGRARLMLRSMPRIIAFSESDLFFWIGLGIVLGRLRAATYLIGLATAAWLLIMLAIRGRTVLALERARRRR